MTIATEQAHVILALSDFSSIPNYPYSSLTKHTAADQRT
jgi:hypothetical protein